MILRGSNLLLLPGVFLKWMSADLFTSAKKLLIRAHGRCGYMVKKQLLEEAVTISALFTAS